MLEKPNINEADIIACLLSFYGLQIKALTFLPLGADFASAVYQGKTKDHKSYFIKLRTDNFQETSILLLDFFHEQGIEHIIPPLRTQDGSVWIEQEGYILTVFPFVEGMNGVEQPLTTTQYAELGKTMKHIHNLIPSSELTTIMKKEGYSTHYADRLDTLLQNPDLYQTGLAAELAGFLHAKESELRKILSRARQLRKHAMTSSGKNVICHADFHAYNLLMAEDDQFFIIDWDEAILAPKERDLMFIDSGVGGEAEGSHELQEAFYTAYQADEISMGTIAYYRYARIIEDIVLYCDEIFAGTMNEKDQQQSFIYLKSNFIPNGTSAKAGDAYAQVEF